MRKILLAVIILAAIGAAIPFAGTALAAYNQRPATSASGGPATSASGRPSSASQPSWAPTWGPPANFGPGTIAPDGAPDYIGSASCPTAGNQQSSSGGSRHRQGGQQPAQGGQPAPVQSQLPPSGS